MPYSHGCCTVHMCTSFTAYPDGCSVCANEELTLRDVSLTIDSCESAVWKAGVAGMVLVVPDKIRCLTIIIVTINRPPEKKSEMIMSTICVGDVRDIHMSLVMSYSVTPDRGQWGLELN
ncbi:hypothetical protein BaRGS_00038496 [Batillaria attramentaria]|uniref:Uncharacterized protein n=1 Tax=Batillaria attramentaria TaxID=370345 RepID=A0ABD0J5N9_9CAEN